MVKIIDWMITKAENKVTERYENQRAEANKFLENKQEFKQEVKTLLATMMIFTGLIAIILILIIF